MRKLLDRLLNFFCYLSLPNQLFISFAVVVLLWAACIATVITVFVILAARLR